MRIKVGINGFGRIKNDQKYFFGDVNKKLFTQKNAFRIVYLGGRPKEVKSLNKIFNTGGPHEK